jgi:hypothetical protein
MATLKDLERQIFAREGFRVILTPLDPKSKSFPAYDYSAMAPQRWKLSDWKMKRLAAYQSVLRRADALQPDGDTVKRDLQLGNLRDAYFIHDYGPIKEPEATADRNVVSLSQTRAKRKAQTARETRG